METEINQAQTGLYSDYDRLTQLMIEAQELSKHNRKYNPAKLTEYFSVLAEIYYNFIYPFFGDTEQTQKLDEKIKLLNDLTRKEYIKLLNNKEYKVNYKVFDFLEDLRRDIERLKAQANLGIQKRKRFNGQKRLKISME